MAAVGSLIRRGNRLADEAAFTLIEILVVCLLVSIVLAATIPVVHDTLLTDQLRVASRKVIGTVRELREDAIRSRQAYILSFDLDRKRFWYERADGRDRGGESSARNGTRLPSSVRILDIRTKSAGRQSRGIVNLWISRQGYMDMTVIHLAGDSDTLSIFFSAFLGSIKVVAGYADME